MKLEDFYGRGDAVKSLIQDIRQGRAPNALLITGQSGIGKRTFALLLARALLCEDPEPLNRPCDKCRNCKRTLKDSHPDLLILKPEDIKKKSIGIDDVRTRLNRLATHTFSGGKRILLYDGSRSITEAAQNALLKSLEEADTDQYFILVSREESSILPTVRSRCRVLRLQPASDDEVIRVLSASGEYDVEKLQAAVSECGGSIGAAKMMLEDEKHWKLRELCKSTFFTVRNVRDIPAASALLKDAKEDGEDLLALTESIIRRLIRNKLLNELEKDDVTPDHWHDLSVQSLTDLSEMLLDAHRYMQNNVGWQALIEKILYSITEELNK